MPLFGFGIIFTEVAGTWTWDSISKALLTGLAGHLALGAVLFVSSKTLLKPSRRETAGSKEVVTTLLVGSIARSMAIASSAVVLGVGDWNLINRVPTSIALVLFSYTLACSSSELWASYRQRREELLYSIAIGNRADQTHDLATAGLIEANVQALESDIESMQQKTLEALAELRDKLRQGDSDLADLSELITSTDRDWREISHRAWKVGKPNVPRITPIEFLRTLAVSKPISLLVLPAGPVYSYFRIFSDLGQAQAVIVFAIWMSISLTLAWSINHLSARVPRFQLLVFSLGFLLLTGWGIGVGHFALEPGSLQVQQAFIALVSTLSAVAIGVGPALEKSGHEVLSQLELMLGASTSRRLKSQGEMFVLARRIGTYLHSEVRGDFLRLAMELRSALQQGDTKRAETIVSQMEGRIADVEPTQDAVNPLKSLSDFLANWGRVIEVSSNVDKLELPAEIASTVEQIVMEAVNDSIRHGKATWVNVQVSKARSGIELIIESNSRFEPRVTTSGIGSLTLAQLGPNAWSRGVSESGTFILRARLGQH
jgi:anti-sigma regulatory factor (Ser/Thr protein kinase)